jgi:hypothetical protein
MPFCLGCTALFFPRIVCLIIYFTSNWLDEVVKSFPLLLVGFVFLPFTLLTYAWIMHHHGQIEGLYFIPLVIAVLMDLGLIGSSARRKRGD